MGDLTVSQAIPPRGVTDTFVGATEWRYVWTVQLCKVDRITVTSLTHSTYLLGENSGPVATKVKHKITRHLPESLGL